MIEPGKPVISVITIVYNGESYIEKTILSVINQTYKNIEFIVVDGQSKDNTVNIVSKYKDRIRHFISEKDNGIYDAMNKGLKLASGEFVNFLNGGDYFYDDHTIEKIFSQRADQWNFVYGDSINTDGKTFQKYIKPVKLSRSSLRSGLGVCHQALFVRRTLSPYYDLSYRYKAEYNWVIDIIYAISPSSIHYHNGPVVYYALGGFSEKGLLKNLREFINITKSRFGIGQVLWNSPLFLKIYLKFYKYKFFGYG
jgi:glycosyltransferase involved in cell wall biosynthesis